MIFFTSDTHFWHKAIIKHCGRPCGDVEEMNEWLIKLWNEVVYPNDTVYHLGDFSFGNATKTTDIFTRLNGNKLLIRGNHDGKAVTKQGWGWIKDYYVIRPKTIFESSDGTLREVGRHIILCHFPFESWENMQYGSWHLHGHCHGTLQTYKGSRRLDVGVDAISEYYPLSIEQVEYIMSSRNFIKVDHHG